MSTDTSGEIHGTTWMRGDGGGSGGIDGVDVSAAAPIPQHQEQSNLQSEKTKCKRRRRREGAAGVEQRTSGSKSSSRDKVRRAPQAVTTEGAWCCVAKPLASPSPPPPRRCNSKPKDQTVEKPPVDIINKENQILEKESAELAKVERSNPTPGDILKTGEISALIKQGFIPDKQPLGSSSPSPNRNPNPNGSVSPFRIRLSPGRVSPIMDSASAALSYGKFNSVLNAGLLNPSSSPPVEKIRSSPTLFEMMAHEQELQPKQQLAANGNVILQHSQSLNGKQTSALQDRQFFMQEKILAILGSCSPGSQFNDSESSDVKLTLSSKDGLSVTLNVHRQILVAHSRFFAAKLSDRWSKQQRSLPHLVEISDCDDVEIYMETLRLMYCKDLKRKLMKENVSKILGILKVSAAIVFDAGMLSCLEYLEAVPWTEEEEDRVSSLLAQLQLESIGAGEVLKRISTEDSNVGASEDILVKLLQLVLKGLKY
ncbi:hypothetical protein SUGI_0045970 [Cryptomeria japonica]|nr:hypothetical protein SUGI_0045970 [Cryptomeria japonica]